MWQICKNQRKLISLISSCLSYSWLCVMLYESESIISFLCCFPCFSWIAFIYFSLFYFYSPSLLLWSFWLSSHLQLSPMCNLISQAHSSLNYAFLIITSFFSRVLSCAFSSKYPFVVLQASCLHSILHILYCRYLFLLLLLYKLGEAVIASWWMHF